MARNYRLAANSLALGTGRDGLNMGAQFPNGSFMAPSHPVVQSLVASGGVSTLTFWADPVRTYTVQCASNIAASAWTNVMRVPTNVTSRLITVTKPALSAAGFYRLVTPAKP